jgi:hypothetical protein
MKVLDEGVVLLGGVTLYGASPAQIATISHRDSFIRDYAETKGWDVNKLTFEQVLEIRKQEGWKNPQ